MPKVVHGLLLAFAEHKAITSSDSLLSVVVFLKGGDESSCQKTPFVVVGGVLQLFKQREWLLTPLTQLLPGSVAIEPSVSAVSVNPPVQPKIQGPPLDPPVKSLPISADIGPPLLKLWVYQSVDAVVWRVPPVNGGAAG